jgi:hypothetical protein
VGAKVEGGGCRRSIPRSPQPQYLNITSWLRSEEGSKHGCRRTGFKNPVPVQATLGLVGPMCRSDLHLLADVGYLNAHGTCRNLTKKEAATTAPPPQLAPPNLNAPPQSDVLERGTWRAAMKQPTTPPRQQAPGPHCEQQPSTSWRHHCPARPQTDSPLRMHPQ